MTARATGKRSSKKHSRHAASPQIAEARRLARSEGLGPALDSASSSLVRSLFAGLARVLQCAQRRHHAMTLLPVEFAPGTQRNTHLRKRPLMVGWRRT